MCPGGSTYDDQLIRDLTLKSTDAVMDDASFIEDIKEFVIKFNLGLRCFEAATAIAAVIKGGARLSDPHVASLKIGDRSINERFEGTVIQVSVIWPNRDSRRWVRPVTISHRAWCKLLASYAKFGAEADSVVYPDIPQEELSKLRAATVVLRYESCLASGSLQLCADSDLKKTFHEQGFHVVDLCASPINAYMSLTSSGGWEPNVFCSAFYDTDRYFGGMGSALHFNVERLWGDKEKRGDRRPLLLTLDVPYDEDLCELLFTKLAEDCGVVSTARLATAGVVVDYVLVLPLWWKLIFPSCPKTFFGETQRSEGGGDDQASMWSLIDRQDAYLRRGFRCTYRWTQRLTQPECAPWVVFDGIFVKDRYTYFDTATNRVLSGVTATEVVAMAQPRDRNDLRDKIQQYYLSEATHQKNI
jgi:hypothetical protein